MVFLASLSYGMRLLEISIFVFVAIMSIALWVEMYYVGPDYSEMFKGWTVGFAETTNSDIFSLAGILGSVVMPHNLYLHTAAVQSKRRLIKQSPDVLEKAVKYCSIEPIIPILVSFFVNMAVVSIAAESVYGSEGASSVGLTNFCTYFQSLKGGCLLWATALLAAGQSGAITTTYTGQYVMDGFLQIQVAPWLRCILTRLVVIAPSVAVSVMFPDKLNQLVNVVNALLGLLLPFAFTPLVKYNCSESIMGEGNASGGKEKVILYLFATIVWAVNATTISVRGGGFFGEIIPDMESFAHRILLVLLQLAIQVSSGMLVSPFDHLMYIFSYILFVTMFLPLLLVIRRRLCVMYFLFGILDLVCMVEFLYVVRIDRQQGGDAIDGRFFGRGVLVHTER
jgi:Mn2+/Fe2+ NRAMP family transporter